MTTMLFAFPFSFVVITKCPMWLKKRGGLVNNNAFAFLFVCCHQSYGYLWVKKGGLVTRMLLAFLFGFCYRMFDGYVGEKRGFGDNNALLSFRLLLSKWRRGYGYGYGYLWVKKES